MRWSGPRSAPPASAAWPCPWCCWWALRKSGFLNWWPRPGRCGSAPAPSAAPTWARRSPAPPARAWEGGVEGVMEGGIGEGATLELDGRRPLVPGFESGNFVGPTIFSNVKPGMAIYQQEIFGPVLALVPAPDIDAAIAFINDNPNGNGTAIFTQSG